MATQIEVVVDGRWLSMECLYGDVEMSTVWPGGSDELSWVLGLQDGHRFAGGETVTGYYGAAPVFAGSLPEPDPSQERMVAQGAWREAENYAALDGTGAATKVVDTAIDQAISRGLRWTRPVSIKPGSLGVLDTSQGPVMLDALLALMDTVDNVRWGVDPQRQVYRQSDPTTPTYQTLPLAEGLGYALDDYASTLIGRYLDSGTSTYKTVTATDTTAETLHGHREQIVDLVTGRAAMASATATSILTNLLALGKAIPQWTAPLEFSYGGILNTGGAPVALETVAAGNLLRVHGGYELAQRLNGLMYLDVLIGHTQLAGGVLQVQPIEIASRNLVDVLTAALAKS